MYPLYLYAHTLTMSQLSSWWGGSSPKPAPEAKPFDPTDPKQNPLNPQGLKPYVVYLNKACLCIELIYTHRCCACPNTKSARDDCFLRYDSSEATEKCKDLVQAHMTCMRNLGFKI